MSLTSMRWPDAATEEGKRREGGDGSRRPKEGCGEKGETLSFNRREERLLRRAQVLRVLCLVQGHYGKSRAAARGQTPNLVVIGLPPPIPSRVERVSGVTFFFFLLCK